MSYVLLNYVFPYRLHFLLMCSYNLPLQCMYYSACPFSRPLHNVLLIVLLHNVTKFTRNYMFLYFCGKAEILHYLNMLRKKNFLYNHVKSYSTHTYHLV
jgi:hypothetical protein